MKKLQLYNEHMMKIYSNISTDRVKIEVQRCLGDQSPLETSLTYGDIDTNSFVNMLIRCSPRQGEVFVDLGRHYFPCIVWSPSEFIGSGTGRAVVAASLLFGDILNRAHGIELLPVLHSYAVQSIEAMSAILEAADLKTLQTSVTTVEQADFLENCEYDWTQADIVFINSTCFSDSLMHQLQSKAEKLRRGARVMTLTKHFNSTSFRIVDMVNYTMSWGLATCYFHQKQ